ncbi:MAG: PTS fructose transporter subunit IIABC [Blautia sp.]
MKITQLLDRNSISLDASPGSKTEALDQAIDLMVKSGNINNVKAYKEQVYLREEEGTTGVGDGIAIPHGRGAGVTRPGLAAMVIPGGVDFDALDDEPVHLLFLIAAPNTKDNVHLDVLSRLSVLLMDEVLVDRLVHAESVDAFLSIIDEKDRMEEAGTDGTAVPEENSQETSGRILAVTSCPTGIAHTYMAAEGLEKAARAAGCSIKVETRGSGGAKNVLTEQEIQEADCIIVAADAKVPMDRFHGKRVIESKVSDGISKADQLIQQALYGEVPLYQGGSEKTTSVPDGKQSAGHKVYTQLMNGVSHMLPFVVGGGILIAIAFLIDGLMVDMESLPESLRGEFGTITPAAAIFKNIGGAAFGFMLPILAGFIAMSIGDRPALALGIVGGALAANGKSGFLGALLAGFLAGYVVLLLRRVFDKLPNSIEKIAPVLLYPVLGILAVGLIMAYVVEPPVGALNTALNTGLTNMGSGSKLLLGMAVAGMMSIDMGGPFNKAAYVFGTASIAAGNYDIMAAVMIGGMVPPCAIALSTMLFRRKYSKQERESGPANFIMGLAFITEGAIPYAASDPLRVLPSCILGSAVAGGLSMAFGCTLMAPHGGIFVFPVVGHPWMYLLALVAGTIAGAVLLGLVKRPVRETEAAGYNS